MKVSRKADAVRLSRELKIIFDLVMGKINKNQSITWSQVRQAVDQTFDIIYQRYVQAVETHGPDYNDEYNPLKFIPPEYDQYIHLNDSTVNWKNIPDLQQLADKIIQWKDLKISKDSREYNLFCYRTTAQMIHEHELKKENFKSELHCYDFCDQNQHCSCVSDNSSEQDNCQKKQEWILVKDFYSTFWEETKNGWTDKTKKEYKGVYEIFFSYCSFCK